MTPEERVDIIKKCLRRLSYREREVIKLRYGLGNGYCYTLEECGYIFKVTRERIRQIEIKANAKLAEMDDFHRAFEKGIDNHDETN